MSSTESGAQCSAADPHRVLWGIVERFEDLSHLPSGPEVHPEAGHGAACSQADHTKDTTQNINTK